MHTAMKLFLQNVLQLSVVKQRRKDSTNANETAPGSFSKRVETDTGVFWFVFPGLWLTRNQT